MEKDSTLYRLVIKMEDLKIIECLRRFETENDLVEFAEDYLDGNQYVMNVYNSSGRKIHSFEYGVGSHNRMKLYDNI